MITDDQVEKALDYLRDNTAEAAQATADRIYMEEYTKVVRSEEMKKRGDLPGYAQEREAYASAPYKDHLNALREAVRIERQHLFMRESAKAKLEAYKTMSFNHKAMAL